jgi:prephenate dehydrogenase
MPQGSPFSRVAVLGTGLIGGSFALAFRALYPHVPVIGWDRLAVAQRAAARGAVTQVAEDLGAAISGADLVYVALPVGSILERLPEIARAAAAHALVTDAGSTKTTICRAAARAFPPGGGFVGGHPLAGRESSGIESASADLFREARYVLVGEEREARAQRLAGLLGEMGARVVWLDAETHDWAAAIISHLPQLLSIALAAVVREETDETGLPLALAGTGLQDSLRLAGGPYDLWRDICLTNTDNIARALDRLAQAVDYLRTHLTSRELESEFAAANEIYQSLQRLRTGAAEPVKD